VAVSSDPTSRDHFERIYLTAENGGLGLDYTFSVAVAEELGNIKCGSVPMAIGVQTDVATPSLARYTDVSCSFCRPTMSLRHASTRTDLTTTFVAMF